jgi:hypothetical protein
MICIPHKAGARPATPFFVPIFSSRTERSANAPRSRCTGGPFVKVTFSPTRISCRDMPIPSSRARRSNGAANFPSPIWSKRFRRKPGSPQRIAQVSNFLPLIYAGQSPLFGAGPCPRCANEIARLSCARAAPVLIIAASASNLDKPVRVLCATDNHSGSQFGERGAAVLFNSQFWRTMASDRHRARRSTPC